MHQHGVAALSAPHANSDPHRVHRSGRHCGGIAVAFPERSKSSRRRASSATIAARSAFDALPHIAISPMVRKHPRHTWVAGSSVHTLMQGEATSASFSVEPMR